MNEENFHSYKHSYKTKFLEHLQKLFASGCLNTEYTEYCSVIKDILPISSDLGAFVIYDVNILPESCQRHALIALRVFRDTFLRCWLAFQFIVGRVQAYCLFSCTSLMQSKQSQRGFSYCLVAY